MLQLHGDESRREDPNPGAVSGQLTRGPAGCVDHPASGHSQSSPEAQARHGLWHARLRALHYKYESGREGDGAIICLASQNNYISLYLCARTPKGYLAETNKARLGNVSVGKCCIRFKKLEDLNLKVAIELVQTAAELAQVPGGFAM